MGSARVGRAPPTPTNNTIRGRAMNGRAPRRRARPHTRASRRTRTKGGHGPTNVCAGVGARDDQPGVGSGRPSAPHTIRGVGSGRRAPLTRDTTFHQGRRCYGRVGSGGERPDSSNERTHIYWRCFGERRIRKFDNDQVRVISRTQHLICGQVRMHPPSG